MFAQTTRISGTVISGEDNLPIIGATVRVPGAEDIGTITNADGQFSLSIPQGTTVVTVSYIGMQSQDAPVSPNMRVVLLPATEMLDDVIVVGYGTQRKKDVTSAISRVGGEDISNLAAPSFESQLAGRAAGVQVTTASGMIGQAPEFQIRGYSTISSGSQPLIIIDGIPVTSGQFQQGYARFNPLGDINPNDIQSIEILKDGAATAIYGSRAANGVVLITTKKGTKGSAKVTYDGYVGLSQPARLHELLNAEEFVMIANEKTSAWGMGEYAVYDGTDTNWNDYIFRTGMQQSHTIAATGGTDKSQYYVSAGYTNQKGIIRANDMQRFTAKADVTQTATKWLQVGINAQASYTNQNGVMNEENSLGSVGFAGVRMLPNVSVFNPDDPTGYNVDAVNRKALGRGSNLTYIDNGVTNIVWAMDNNKNVTKNTRVLAGGFAEITFMPGLTLRTQAGMDILKMNDFFTWNGESGDGYGYGGLIDEVNTTQFNWNWQNVLNFNRTFGLHNVAATVVGEYTRTDYELTDASVNLLSDGFFGTDHIISNSFGDKGVGGSKSSYGLASYMFRANYNYDSKYYLGGSIRRDGLSRLPEGTRWGTFYGASAAWRLSREAFWTNSSVNEWFNDLRIRASYATIGNSEVGSNYFPYLGTYAARKYGSYSAIAWSNMGNDQLKWESTETMDIGLDGSMFNGRLNFEIAYFVKNTKDLVSRIYTAPTLGIPGNSYYDNLGKIANSGLELTLGGTPVHTRDFMWKADFNISFIKNEVKELVNGTDVIDVYTIIREGESYRSLYGYDYYGVNKENGNPIWRKSDGKLVQFSTFGSADLGEVEYDYAEYDPANPADVSKPASLSATTDRKLLGSSLPTWYGGFNNTFTYKDFDLNIFFRFSGGNKIMNASRPQTLLNLDFSSNGKEILGRWVSKTQPGDGMTPRIGYGDDSYLWNQNFADSHFVEDGSFLKLSNITLGYKVPEHLIRDWGFSSLRFYLQAQNLFTITGYKGLDPETSTRRGVDWDGMPQQRIFTLGANIAF
jgi:TonB-linked SusC/RagA family outer membrane protein